MKMCLLPLRPLLLCLTITAYLKLIDCFYYQRYWNNPIGYHQYRRNENYDAYSDIIRVSPYRIYENDKVVQYSSANLPSSFYYYPRLTSNIDEQQNRLPYYEYWRYYRYYHPSSNIKRSFTSYNNGYPTSYTYIPSSYSVVNSNYWKLPYTSIYSRYLNLNPSNWFWSSTQSKLYPNLSYFPSKYFNKLNMFYSYNTHLATPKYSNYVNNYYPYQFASVNRYNYSHSNLDRYFEAKSKQLAFNRYDLRRPQHNLRPYHMWTPSNNLFYHSPPYSFASNFSNFDFQRSQSISSLYSRHNYDAGNMMRARVKLKGSNNIKGIINFYQKKNQPVQITGRVSGLSYGPHGMHIHELPVLNNDCTRIGGHYNPQLTEHGAKHDWIRHVGDLGNIIADKNGVAEFDISDIVISLSGGYSVINRTLTITQSEDNLGREADMDSKQTGKSGPPLVCGLIELIKN